MQSLLPLLLLACPIGMGLMMWYMMRGNQNPAPTHPAETQDEIARLRAEVALLRAEQRDRSTGDPSPRGW